MCSLAYFALAMTDFAVSCVYISTMIKKVWLKLVMGETTPHNLAFGVAFGTLVALLPTFGFSVAIALGLLIFMPKINRPAVLLALAFWNPLMQIPVYALSLEVGSALYTGDNVVMYQLELLNQLHTYTLRFLLGHLSVTLLFTIMSYLVAFIVAKIIACKPNAVIQVTQMALE